MNQPDFDELIESVRERGRILRGEVAPSREFSCTPEDVQSLTTALPVAVTARVAAKGPAPVPSLSPRLVRH